MTPVSSSSANATTRTPSPAAAIESAAPATSTAPAASAAPADADPFADSFDATSTATSTPGDGASRSGTPNMCRVDAPVDPELNAAMQSQLQAQMGQARLGAPSPASPSRDTSFGTQLAQSAGFILSGLSGGAFGVSDPGPAIEQAIDADPRLGDAHGTLTEGAELVGHGAGSIMPEWISKLGPRANIDNMHRAGETYPNGYKEWSKSTDDGETWQRYVGRADDKPMTANGLGYGEGFPVDDDFDVNTLKTIN